MPTSANTARRPRLPRPLEDRVFARSLALQASWNDQRMQNLGLLATLAPWLRDSGLDLPARRRFCQRHMAFFNTNPYLANLIIGSVLRLEAENLREGRAPHATSIVAVREALARACGSLGDQFFWLGLRPAVAMAAILFGLGGWWPAVLALVAGFGVVQIVARRRWLAAGYALGRDIVDLLARPAWHRAIVATKRAALALTGVVAGAYFAAILDRDALDDAAWRPAAGFVLGLLLPLLLRQRLPGEALALLGLLLVSGAAFLFA